LAAIIENAERIAGYIAGMDVLDSSAAVWCAMRSSAVWNACAKQPIGLARRQRS
jgi:hypothetical protein